jgi:hypothetical protein
MFKRGVAGAGAVALLYAAAACSDSTVANDRENATDFAEAYAADFEAGDFEAIHNRLHRVFRSRVTAQDMNACWTTFLGSEDFEFELGDAEKLPNGDWRIAYEIVFPGDPDALEDDLYVWYDSGEFWATLQLHEAAEMQKGRGCYE